MNYIKQTVQRTVLGLAECVTPILKDSKFKETGVITPEEFVRAGDFLTYHCPTWQWATGDKDIRTYLPKEKQYLITRSVPCYKRVKDLADTTDMLEKVVEQEDGDGGWVDTHHYAEPSDNIILEMDKQDEPPKSSSSHPVNQFVTEDENSSDEDQEPVDMEAFLQSGMLDEIDPATSTGANKLTTTSNNSSDLNELKENKENGILQTRTYDLYITYDKYYQTPRLWLYGYDEQGQPLKEEQMYEDFSQDHAQKTVTTEIHPHLTGHKMPSIHPCGQAQVMLKLIQTMADCGAQLFVDQYIMIFLKFVQAVIPSIEYDYTRNFNMSAPS